MNGAPADEGIIPRAVVDIFKRVDELRAEGVKASVHASFLEVNRIVYCSVKRNHWKSAYHLHLSNGLVRATLKS